MRDVYCAVVVMAHPNYKRPYSSTVVKHFKTEKEGEDWIQEQKTEYYSCYGFDQNSEEEFNEDEWNERIYSNSYMGMSPFDGYVLKVEME